MSWLPAACFDPPRLVSVFLQNGSYTAQYAGVLQSEVTGFLSAVLKCTEADLLPIIDAMVDIGHTLQRIPAEDGKEARLVRLY